MQKPSVPANIQTPMTLLLCILWQTRITLHLLLDSAQRYQCINSTLQYRFCLHGKKVMTIFASSKSHGYGKMPEWSIGAVSKTVVPLRVPRVRIPVFPLRKLQVNDLWLF